MLAQGSLEVAGKEGLQVFVCIDPAMIGGEASGVTVGNAGRILAEASPHRGTIFD